MSNRPPLLVKYSEVAGTNGKTVTFDFSGMSKKPGYTPCLLCFWENERDNVWEYESSDYSRNEIVYYCTEVYSWSVFDRGYDSAWLTTPYLSGTNFNPYFTDIPFRYEGAFISMGGTVYPISWFKDSEKKLTFSLSKGPGSTNYVQHANKSVEFFYFFIYEHPEIFQMIPVTY